MGLISSTRGPFQTSRQREEGEGKEKESKVSRWMIPMKTLPVVNYTYNMCCSDRCLIRKWADSLPNEAFSEMISHASLVVGCVAGILAKT